VDSSVKVRLAVRPRFVAASASHLGALVLLLLWTRSLQGGYLAAAAGALALGFLSGGLWRVRREAAGAGRQTAGVHLLAATAFLLAALAAGVITESRLSRIGADWDAVLTEREDRLRTALAAQMERVLLHGTATAVEAAELARHPGAALFGSLAELRSRSAVSALAVFDHAGELIAWAGDHRGPVPDEARSGASRVIYAERPLFSYLYFLAPVGERGRWAMAAVLLQSGLALEGEVDRGLAGSFRLRHGAGPRFGRGASPDAAWSLFLEDAAVAHARFEPVTQAGWRREVAAPGRMLVAGLSGVALLLLGLGWLRAMAGPAAAGEGVRRLVPIAPLAAVAVAGALLPWDEVLGLQRLFSPALFILPGPVGASLGTYLAVLLPIAALAGVLRPPALLGRAPLLAVLLGGVAVAIGFPVALQILLRSAAPPLLEGGPFLWGALQPAAVLTLAVIAVLALPSLEIRALPPALAGERARRLLVVAAALATALLGLLVIRYWEAAVAVAGGRETDASLAALWALPFMALALAIASLPRGRVAARWLIAGWLAATAVIPHLWMAHQDARLRAAERELATLGSTPDPLLDYLLRHFAEEVSTRHVQGEHGVELLYRSWLSSGLAREAYPVGVTLWSADRLRLVELELSGAAPAALESAEPPRFLGEIIDHAFALGHPVVEAPGDEPGLRQVLAVPLATGEAVTVAVPPRRSLEQAPALAPYLGVRGGQDARLVLVPAGLERQLHTDTIIEWRWIDDGWRSEAVVRYPEGEYHAHLEIRVASMAVRIARALLLVALNLGLMALLWIVGRAALGDVPGLAVRPMAWFRSFRARVTVALFGFFLLPTILFGMVAYQALSGEVARTAAVVAERAAWQAAVAFPDSIRDLRTLAARTGEEVLFFRDGELAVSSSREALELGLYGAWMPPPVFLALQSGEELSVLETRELGRHDYLIAYRRHPPVGTLAVPVSLAFGAAAARQRELTHLILFAALMGGILSLALSVAVGRALSEPIGRLRRAAGRIGAGDLRVRLPGDRPDEFGELFASFNGMVRRLRRARARELRTARILAWGEMARQVAHEIKNPLTPIKLSVQHLRRTFGDRREDFAEILEESSKQILIEIDRLTDIARAFSRFGAPPEAAGPLEAVNVAAVVREALTLYRASDPGVSYADRVDPALPAACARPGELKEVLLNLLENARAALDGGGSVLVSAAEVDGEIELVVGDDGQGIPPAQLPRIFEPHFSTRTSGTGLGLAIVRRLVEGWGGRVAAESEPGEGTRIRVRMPAQDRLASDDASTAASDS
jgi:signal transduction histidine kinase